MHKPFSIFCIVESKIEGFKIKAIFMEYDFTAAKLWFTGYLEQQKGIKYIDYILYKIGEIDSLLKIKSYKIYVTNGSRVLQDKKDVKQLTFENWGKIQEAKKEAERLHEIKKLYDNGADITEVIKETFKGRIIDDNN